MRLLLDTQVVLWQLAGSWTIPPRAMEAIESAAELGFSVVSFAEIGVKAAIGKLAVPKDLREHVLRSGMRILGLSVDHALGVAELPLHHRGTADSTDHPPGHRCLSPTTWGRTWQVGRRPDPAGNAAPVRGRARGRRDGGCRRAAGTSGFGVSGELVAALARHRRLSARRERNPVAELERAQQVPSRFGRISLPTGARCLQEPRDRP